MSLFKLSPRKSLRIGLLAFFVCIGASITIAASSKKDPLYKEINALESLNDKILIDPNYAEGKLMNILSQGTRDHLVPLNSAGITQLITEFKRVKSLIEQAAQQRELLALNDESILSLAEISARYLAQEKRMTFNFFRNAHNTVGLEKGFSPALYDSLNLYLSNNAGFLLLQTDQIGLRFNLWHVSDQNGHFSKIELGLNPQDKDQIEQAVLQEKVTEESYAKLIQFMSIRERVVNHWALQRMSPFLSVPDSDLYSCGQNLLSFNHSQVKSGGYYQFLQKNDRYEEYVKKDNQ